MEKSAENSDNGSIRKIIIPLIAIALGMLMVIIDGTAMNVVVPVMVKNFKSNLSTVSWIITGYGLAQAMVIPLAGWLSDHFGPKLVFLLSMTLFTLGSLLCSTAANLNMLIIFRIIQGLGGGMVIPAAIILTFKLSPPGKVGKVMSFIGIPTMLGPSLGPVLAGYLVDVVSWRAIFYINIPLGILGLLIGLKTIPNFKGHKVPSMDYMGIILAPLAFLMLTFGVNQGSNGWTSYKALVPIILGIIVFIIFVINELKMHEPLLEMKVFKNWSFNRGMIVQSSVQITLFGIVFLIPLILQQVRGYSVLDTALIMFPSAIASMIIMPFTGIIFDRIGIRVLAISGMIVLLISVFMVFNTVDKSITSLVLSLIVFGIGLGLMNQLNTHNLQVVPMELVGRVTSLINSFMQVITSLTIAGFSTMVVTRYKLHSTQGLGFVAASLSSYREAFIMIGIFTIIGVAVSFTLRRAKVTKL
ncbi:MAG TPA: MDR family MFS transporter [Clostridiaceae bacterium]